MGNVCNNENNDYLISNSQLNSYFDNVENNKNANKIKPIIQNKIGTQDQHLQIGICFDKAGIIDQEICIQSWEGLLNKNCELNPQQTFDLQRALYQLHKNNPQQFEEVFNYAGGGQIRWFIWRTLLYSCIKQKHKAMKIRPTNKLSVIERDVKRTFPNHPYFQLQSQSQQHLSQLLNLIGATFSDTGYTQGMNFVLGFILMVSGGDIDQSWQAAFLLFYCSKWMLYGMYMNEFPLMKLITNLTKQQLQQQDEQLYNHYIKLDIDDIYLFCKWQFTLYLYCIPLQACLTFWDSIISKGIFVMSSINSQLMITMREKILSFKNLDEFLEYAQQLQELEHFSNYKEINQKACSTIPSKKMIQQTAQQMKNEYDINSKARNFLNLIETNIISNNFEEKYQQWMINNINNENFQ